MGVDISILFEQRGERTAKYIKLYGDIILQKILSILLRNSEFSKKI